MRTLTTSDMMIESHRHRVCDRASSATWLGLGLGSGSGLGSGLGLGLGLGLGSVVRVRARGWARLARPSSRRQPRPPRAYASRGWRGGA
eukprot:scaffold21313_cov34-Phaeocystis_antarctica.AAC.1